LFLAVVRSDRGVGAILNRLILIATAVCYKNLQSKAQNLRGIALAEQNCRDRITVVTA